MLTTTHTLTVPAAALAAVEALRNAQYLLNAANEGYAWSGDATPYGATEQAILRTLGEFLGGDMSDERTVVFARFVLDMCHDNGESIEHQITQVLGWTLVVEEAAHYPSLTGRTVPGAGYGRIVPMILGGEDYADRPYPLSNTPMEADVLNRR